MPSVPPWLVLAAALALTFGVGAAALVLRRRERRAFAALAARHGWNFSPGVAQDLSRRIGPHLPVIGPAAVRASDVMRHADGRLMARVDYTLGSVRHRRNLTRVVACQVYDGGAIANVRIAATDGPRRAQFAALLKSESAA